MMRTVKMPGFIHNSCYGRLLSLVLISDNCHIQQVDQLVYLFHKRPKFDPGSTILIPEHNHEPNRGHITVHCDSVTGEKGIFSKTNMTRICHEQSFELRHSVGCKRWCEVDAIEILGTISFPTKLVDDQLTILYLSFIGVEYTIVKIFST